MFLVNFISRNDTDQFTPLFEMIYCVEISFTFLAFFASSFVSYLLINASRMPRMAKLRIMFTVFLACMYVSARLLVMHHQYFGPSEYVEKNALIFGSMVMQTFISYMSSLVLFLALDRLVATRFWAWYESGTSSTILFFALQEFLLYTIAVPLAYLIVYEYISSMQSVYCFAINIIIGATVFALVFRHNLRALRELKQGAVVNHYSVSRSFQIKENVDLLTLHANRAPSGMRVPASIRILSGVFIVPANIGYDGLRFFSASMYHLWLSMASAIVIASLPLYFPRLMQTLKRRVKHSRTAPSGTFIENTTEIGDAYFNILTDNWK